MSISFPSIWLPFWVAIPIIFFAIIGALQFGSEILEFIARNRRRR